ncbi:MAG: hypothetical protein LBM08_00725 [Dysgonamonadaceae bacterium]|nr:hypothetical protein [Dysgonamonadaceae bacterium]
MKEEPPKVPIKDFLKSFLSSEKLKQKRDFCVYPDHLFVAKHPANDKMLSTLNKFYPEYTFYWENSRILKWF